MNYNNDFFESSELSKLADELVDNYCKEKLKLSIKKEYQEEIERLRKKCKEFLDKKDELAERCQKLEAENEKYKLAAINAKNMTLHKLFEPYSKTMWGFEKTYEYVREKCDKCDMDGYIHYKTPSGRDAKEECSCRKRKVVYKPVEAEIIELSQCIAPYRDRDVQIYFKYYRDQENEDKCYLDDKYKKVKEIYRGQSFEDVSKLKGIVFPDKEKCQEYCDWLSRKVNEGGIKK